MFFGIPHSFPEIPEKFKIMGHCNEASPVPIVPTPRCMLLFYNDNKSNEPLINQPSTPPERIKRQPTIYASLKRVPTAAASVSPQ